MEGDCLHDLSVFDDKHLEPSLWGALSLKESVQFSLQRLWGWDESSLSA